MKKLITTITTQKCHICEYTFTKKEVFEEDRCIDSEIIKGNAMFGLITGVNQDMVYCPKCGTVFLKKFCTKTQVI